MARAAVVVMHLRKNIGKIEIMSATGPVSQTRLHASEMPHRQRMLEMFKQRPISDEELLVNTGLFLRSGALAKILFLDEIYKKIISIPGCICEFGVWWGQSLALFENLRAVYEPYNHTRLIVGFDTFEGYKAVGEHDKRSATISEGVYGLSDNYFDYLDELLSLHEQENVMSHVKKHLVVKGDVTETVPQFFLDHPEQLVSLAYFDLALYEPTKIALSTIASRMVSGSVVAFDELNNASYPGETVAALEVLNLREWSVARSRVLPDRTIFTKL
ncbi:hypothetical protein MKK84_01875 [Methylobacterium sp. E-065]|uniref:hypothetical protein n=1 Tax=Methylobacterium sp. E-065 TaxID=2836583 RepID=UPI001FBA9ED4|nr:hypothetical protein [Methylobacterium sp. E-065]MCJ2016187.1 hypothetical protein [Methylobacterium sp. E-065]